MPPHKSSAKPFARGNSSFTTPGILSGLLSHHLDPRNPYFGVRYGHSTIPTHHFGLRTDHFYHRTDLFGSFNDRIAPHSHSITFLS